MHFEFLTKNLFFVKIRLFFDIRDKLLDFSLTFFFEVRYHVRFAKTWNEAHNLAPWSKIELPY
ncbi:MAG: hypothetical protein A3F31_03625 [Candidatus Levybacteria bacterium RIFCSPHIGHO2_12_FULL_38_12]|nr:MAG: hypothetical protein A3F31_03625 [Candidatus Levybacteria bacterium RIFCSPHIGHO2_12_FULL_38_12]OGH34428.1 MAG: hypothetical protein A3A47_02860 [Candidatus Levybacteria bacterium RIFCSPLOWO2_01_FULL_37_20]